MVSARHVDHQQAWSIAAAGALVALTVGVPLVAVAARVDAAHLAVLASARPWVLLARSLALAAAVTAGAIALGAPIGAVLARARIPFRRALFALHVFPVFLPPFFDALGWFHLFGAQGSLGGARTASLLFAPAGAWAVLVLAFTPIVTALTALGVRSLDPSLEEAGLVVARPARVLASILVPAARAQIALGALIVFALALAELGVPMFLRVDVYPAAVFARLGGADFAPGEAVALTMPIAAVAVVLTAIERHVASRAHGPGLSLRVAARAPLDVGPLGLGLAALGAVLSMAPLAALAAHAAPALATTPAWIGSSVQNGLLVSSITAVIATPAGIALGHALARGRRAARLLDAALLFAFFVPSAVLGVGVVSAWNGAATALVYTTEAILVLGFLGRYGVLAVRAFAASSSQTPASYEQAAAIAGSRYLHRLTRIVVPMQRRGVLAAFGLTLVFCLRDLDTAVLFYPPGGEPLTVRIFTLEANGPTRVVAALALLHAAITAAVLFALVWLFERSER